MTNELWRNSALDLAEGIRSKKFSSREVVDAHLARIDEVNPKVNALIHVMADEARTGADAADKALAQGGPVGPLHGVPYTVKINIDVAGQATTQGIAALAGAIPAVDAPTIERMRASGAIMLGRTNMPDMGLRVHTDSALYGRTKNPWKSDRTAGGSSGGEGAALASGMSPLGLGNDIGGSLRNPAHCCGIASIMPTKGVVPDAQMFPIEDFGLSSQLMLGQGVMARRIADVRAGLRVVAGAHARDPISVPVVLDEFPAAKKTRVVVMTNPPGGTTHPQIMEAVRNAADALSNAGHEVVEGAPPDFELACQLWSDQMNGELTLQFDLLNMVMGEGGRQFLELTREGMAEIDFAGWANAQTQRNGVARRWSLWFQENPILICPTWTEPAFMYDYDIKDVESAMGTLQQLRAVLPANLLGLPAVVVPGGMADSLPVGIQVIGSRFTDLHCLAIAEQIESACGLSTPIDPIN